MKRLVIALPLVMALWACGPTVQQIQATECANESFSIEWACIKSRMANNPRHQLPGLQDAVAQYTFYGNKLKTAVRKGLMSDSAASIAILQFANQLDSALLAEASYLQQLQNAINQNKPITCNTFGSTTTCY